MTGPSIHVLRRADGGYRAGVARRFRVARLPGEAKAEDWALNGAAWSGFRGRFAAPQDEG
jgi:hypothetical protein